MKLSDRDLKVARTLGRFSLEPWTDAALQPASIDVRLGPRILIWRHELTAPLTLGADATDRMTALEIPADRPFFLQPGQMVLAQTLEWLTLGADLAAQVDGKSSNGRCGLGVHVTAGYLDPGWSGRITLELVNHAPIALALPLGAWIAQLRFEPVSSAVHRPYGHTALGSRYQGADGPQAARGEVKS